MSLMCDVTMATLSVNYVVVLLGIAEISTLNRGYFIIMKQCNLENMQSKLPPKATAH